MKIERFSYIVVRVEELCEKEQQIIRKKTTTTSGSNTWVRYQSQIEEVRCERLALWKEIRQAIYGEETGRG